MAHGSARHIFESFALWLDSEGRLLPDAGDLLAESCSLLVRLGLPLDRATTHIKIVHPQARSVWRVWRRDRPMEVRRAVHGVELTPAFLRSPVRRVWDAGLWFSHRLTASVSEDWPILDDLRTEGFTHYVIGPLQFSNRQNNAISFATRCESGFMEDEIVLLHRIAARLTPVIEIMSLRRGMYDLFDTYLGHATMQLLADGQVRLGNGRQLRATLLYSDLRGFTSLTEGAPLDEVVRVLNAYFGLVGAAASRHGGEVVQFIGDAILIFFAAGALPEADLAAAEPSRYDDADACRRAAAATAEALTELHRWNTMRRESGQREIEFGIGLDLGDVIHVNVGAAGRQAFNLIGPAVNRAARIQELTKLVKRPALASGEFARALGAPHHSLGEHELRGVPHPVEVVELLFDPSPLAAAPAAMTEAKPEP